MTKKNIPNKAFILAAGLGSRLRPYTNKTPKPLVKVNGKTLLDRTLDHLKNVNITDISLNTHYHADQIENCIANRPEFSSQLSYEDNLLDTGGGIKKMIHHFDDSFFVLSGDSLWDNAKTNTLKSMQDFWNPENMDILMLLQPISCMTKTKPVGDYHLNGQGKATRALDKTGDTMFTSIRINHPRIFDQTPDGPFSYLDLMDRAQEKGRLYGIIHQGDWHHISTPDDLETIDSFYKKEGL
ncbi:MAG: nucleotidyltransferase family protein [Bdellovibrionales bacterium]